MRTARVESTDARASSFALLILIAALTATAISSFPLIRQPGYILDEEITDVLVPSLTRHAAPTLPSGLLYLRGLPYLYATAAVARVFGYHLVTYRTLSVAFALAALVMLYVAGRRIATPAVGVIAVVLLCSFPGFVAIAAFARPYSLLLAAFSLGLICFQEFNDRRRSDALFLACVVFCRLLHEFGLALAAYPALVAVSTTRPEDRRRLVRVSVKALMVALLVEAVLYLIVERSLTTLFVPLSDAPAFRPVRMPPVPTLHLWPLATPTSFALVIVLPLVLAATFAVRRTGAWIVTAGCVALGILTQLGAMIAFVFLAMLARPRRAGVYAAIGASIFGTSALVWVVHTFLRSYVQPSLPAALSLITGMTPYPLAAIHYIWTRWPATAWAAAAGAVSLVIAERHGNPVPVQRACASLAILIYLFFAILGVDIQMRFLLLGFPVLLLLAAVGINSIAQMTARMFQTVTGWNPRWTTAIMLIAVSSVVAIGLRSYDEDDALRTIRPLSKVAADEVIICSEELACIYLFGRVDYLLLMNPVDLSYYAGRRGGELRGLYAGSPVVSTASDLKAVLQKHQDKRRAIVMLETGKADIFPLRRLAADLARLHTGRITSTPDATIAYFDPTTLGSLTGAASAEAPDLAASSPSTRSR